jgi:hypothetical protein
MEGERGAAELRRRGRAQARVFFVLSLFLSLCVIAGCAVELAKPSVSFAQDVALRDGPNPVEIVSVDLLGQLTRHLITVYVDRQGPVLSLDAVEVLAEFPQQRVRVKGFLSDRSHLVRFLLAGQRMPLPPERE